MYLAPTVAAPGSRPGPVYTERLLEVDINRQEIRETVFVLEDQAGVLYLWDHDLQRWRFRQRAASAAIEYQGQTYFPLSAIAETSHVFDHVARTLLIEVRPGAFVTSARSAQPDKIPPPASPSPGGFFNYDLFFAHSPGSTQRAGQFELGYFNRFGVGIANVLAQDLGSHTHLTRLDTTWTVDFPEKLRTLRIGDAINDPGTWGRSVRFGGIQYGSNFGTQPGFVTFPPQSVAGQAVMPSTVDIFINNALVARQNVPPGPFTISNLPVVTGAGEIRLVVRDLLGREQLVSQPMYASQALLAKGLDQFSVAAGQVRENFGIQSNDYGSWLGSGTYRRGLSDRLTGELHAEATQNQMAAGVGGDALIPQFGTINAYVAGSQRQSTRGSLLLLGVDRQAQPWSIGARTLWTSSGFAQVGLPEGQMAPARVSTLNLSYSAARAGSIGLALVEQRNRDQPDSRILTVGYSIALGKFGNLSVSAVRNLIGAAETSVFAMLNIPLGAATSLSLSAQATRVGSYGGDSDFTATLQRNLPLGEGYGYRVQARSDGAREATVSMQNNTGTYSAGAAQFGGNTSTQLNATGGVGILGGDVFLSRRIDESFAVARIPDYPDVRLLADNQPAGRTDARGNALIPRLRAYDRNVIAIDQRDLPMDAEIGSLRREAIPYFRSGVEIIFPVRHSRGATFTVHLEDGSPLPLGAAVSIIGQDAVYTVGEGGEVYVAGLGPGNRLRAGWQDKRCEFDVDFTAGTDPLPDLGTFICKGVTP